jgi:hypothetical protein
MIPLIQTEKLITLIIQDRNLQNHKVLRVFAHKTLIKVLSDYQMIKKKWLKKFLRILDKLVTFTLKDKNREDFQSKSF